MTDLSKLKCVACRGGESSVTDEELREYLPQIPEWRVIEVDGVKRLEREFKVKNFARALDFVNSVGAAAEEQDHHPRIVLEWGRVTVQWWTHVIHGLHRNDFIMAARTDAFYA